MMNAQNNYEYDINDDIDYDFVDTINTILVIKLISDWWMRIFIVNMILMMIVIMILIVFLMILFVIKLMKFWMLNNHNNYEYDINDDFVYDFNYGFNDNICDKINEVLNDECPE